MYQSVLKSVKIRKPGKNFLHGFNRSPTIFEINGRFQTGRFESTYMNQWRDIHSGRLLSGRDALSLTPSLS